MSKQKSLPQNLVAPDLHFIEEMAKISGWNEEQCMNTLMLNRAKVYIDNGHFIAMDLFLPKANFPTLPVFKDLPELENVEAHNFEHEVLDLSQTPSVKNIKITDSPNLKKVVVSAGMETLFINNCEGLEQLDITRCDWEKTKDIDIEGTPNLNIYSTEVFYKSNRYIKSRRCEKHLSSSSPLELHSYACKFNWEEGVGVVKWIIEHENCDSGTALMIYWLGKPEYYAKFKKRAEVDSWSETHFSLLRRIEKLYQNNEFKSNVVQFDPKNNPWGNLVGLYPDIVRRREIPESMYLPSNS